MNFIQKEMQSAQQYMLKKMLVEDEKLDLVDLTPENVAMVEAMIFNDSDYLNSGDVSEGPQKDKNGKLTGGSTAYWMTELKKALFSKEPLTKEKYDEIIDGAVSAVDRENSTHLNADGVGREQIARRIKDIDKDMLIDYLRRPDETDLYLFRLISDQTKPDGITPKGKKYPPRSNVSFASKFCHYACYYLFEGEDAQDNYSIFDSVVKSALPYYLENYNIKIAKKALNDYQTYRMAVDAVIRASGSRISRNGFDHLLWYYHKGNPPKREKNHAKVQ